MVIAIIVDCLFLGTIIDIDTVDIGNLQPNPPSFSADIKLDKFETLQQWVTQEYGMKMYIGEFYEDDEDDEITVYLAISLPLKRSITNLTEFFQEIRNGNKLTEYYNLLNLLNQEKKEPELQIRTSVAQWS